MGKVTYNKKEQELTKKFAKAFASFDIAAIEQMLDNDGEFNIKDEDGNDVDRKKKEYILWISQKLNDYQDATPKVYQLGYEFDKCLHCKIGNPVVLFEEGTFPVKPRIKWEKEKLGLMLEFKWNKISGITLCGCFLHTENKYLFELKDPKDFKGGCTPF